MISDSTSLEGKFLVAMPGMGDVRFEKTVIFICAHSDEGSMGFIINRPLETPDISEFFEQLQIVTAKERANIPTALRDAPIRTGGPVEPGRGFVLHSADYEAPTTMKIDAKISLTATLEILRELAMGRGPKQFMLALGYSGWSAGQLEEEIIANGWLVGPADPGVVFDSKDEGKYNRAMGLIGVNPSLLSADAGHA